MQSKNNLSDLLSKLLVLNNNSVESFSRINEAITSDSESVTLDIENADGTKDTFTIPSFGWLKNSIERLNNNINAVSNIKGSGSTVRLSDGTYRKVLASKLPSAAPTITQLNSVNTFKIKSNYFFENMMNPLLCVTLDLTGQVSNDVERVLVRRYILDTDTSAKVDFFEHNYASRPDIKFNDFLYDIVENGINYVLDEEIVQLSPRSRRYEGTFDVIRITNDTVTEIVNGASISRTRKLIKLNTLDYTDNLSGYTNSMRLAVGDSLEIVSDPCDTRYVIKNIDTSTNTVVLELAEGYRSVKIGTGILRVSSEKSNDVSIDVTVGFNERCVVFIKPVDSDSNIMASDWSPGTGFITNDLTFTDANGTLTTLQQYYQKSVIDFGAFLLSYANDWYPTSSEGIIPNAPVLEPTNFKVVQINKQVTESENMDKIKELNAEKVNLFDQVNAKSLAINDLKTKINTTNYVSPAMRTADMTELQSKIKDYESTVSAYSSKVTTISALSQSSSIASVSPKFRIRGFWEMPVEQSTTATGTQAIIKFKIRYRYLSPDGAANNVEQIGDTISGSFSNYAIEESVLRERVKDKNGVFYWKPIDLNDSDEININQLDIPITKGEKVEIQVKSISEAGFPSNPLESEWSEPIIIEFPEEYTADSPVDNILKKNSTDESQLVVNQTLSAKGVTTHVADAFSSNGNVFLHTANSIASGFVTDEQTPINLYQKLAEMQTTINQLLDIIGNSTGVMNVTLSDEDGNVYELKEDTVNKIYAGSYITEAGKLTVKKGAIIAKNFSINIGNSAQTGLRLLSRIAGSRTAMVNESNNYINANTNSTYHVEYPNNGSYDIQDNTYNTLLRYDLVPINLYAADPDETDGVVSCQNNYQSAQCKNQFINMRFYNVGGDIALYKINNTNDEAINVTSTDYGNFAQNEWLFNPSVLQSGNVTESFIWNGTFKSDLTPQNCHDGGPIQEADFLVHIDHPFIDNLETWLTQIYSIMGFNGTNGITPVWNGTTPPQQGNYNADANKYLFRLTRTYPYTITNNAKNAATMRKTTSGTAKNVINLQTPYEYCYHEEDLTSNSWPVVVTADLQSQYASAYPIGLTHKIGFIPEDQYLLGPNTCTSYLFLNPQGHNEIQVEGDSRTSAKVISGGAQISIPLTFQYRMTDYWGSGETGTGRVLGKANLSTVNKTQLNGIYFSNRVGIDIWNTKDNPVSFDIEIYATYTDSMSKISPDSKVQYNASTMASAVNASKNTTKSVLGSTTPIEVTKVTPINRK